jgi:hypothetical protein
MRVPPGQSNNGQADDESCRRKRESHTCGSMRAKAKRISYLTILEREFPC